MVKLHAALAERHGNAAPVAVVAGDAGLDERRVGDGAGGDIGLLVVHGAGNVDRNKLGKTVPLRDDIIKLRYEDKLSQSAIAEILGLHQTAISKFLRNYEHSKE